MNVTKRNGTTEQVSFDKVTKVRILCEMKPKLKNVNYIDISQKLFQEFMTGSYI